MNKVWGGVLVVTGFIACPCHFVITLPIILGALGGTGLGAFLSDNQGLVYGVASTYFIVGLAGGIYLWDRRQSKPSQTPLLSSLAKSGRSETVPTRVKGRKGKTRSPLRERRR